MENQSKDHNQVLEYKGLTPDLISEITYLKVRGITKEEGGRREEKERRTIIAT